MMDVTPKGSELWRPIAALTVLLASCFASGLAGADEADPDARARALFGAATRLAESGRWEEALANFEDSAALHPHAITTYNIGVCERSLRRYTRARERLQQALAMAETGGGVLPAGLIDRARVFIGEIERALGRIDVAIPPETTAIAVDGRPLALVLESPLVLVAGTRQRGRGEPPRATRFTLLIDPGTHVFTLSRAGGADTRATHTFEPGSRDEVTLELDSDEPEVAAQVADQADRPAHFGPPRYDPGPSAARIGVRANAVYNTTSPSTVEFAFGGTVWGGYEVMRG